MFRQLRKLDLVARKERKMGLEKQEGSALRVGATIPFHPEHRNESKFHLQSLLKVPRPVSRAVIGLRIKVNCSYQKADAIDCEINAEWNGINSN